MIKSLFKQASTLARLQSGPLAQELPLLAASPLHNEQYPPETIRRYVRVADKFGRWLWKRGLNITEVDEATLARYRGTTGRRKNGQLRAAGRTLAKVFRLLQLQHGGAIPLYTAQTESEALVTSIDSHLQHAAGLLPGTRAHYLRHATLSPEVGVQHDNIRHQEGDAASDHDFVREQSAKLKPSSCAAPSTSMRVFLRFLVSRTSGG